MKKTAEDHWNYIKSLTEATLAGNAETSVVFSREELLTLIGFHYRSAFIHGWKHAIEAQKATDLPLEICRAEAASCCCSAQRTVEETLRSAVSGAEAARRACDVDNSGKALPKVRKTSAGEVIYASLEEFHREEF